MGKVSLHLQQFAECTEHNFGKDSTVLLGDFCQLHSIGKCFLQIHLLQHTANPHAHQHGAVHSLPFKQVQMIVQQKTVALKEQLESVAVAAAAAL